MKNNNLITAIVMVFVVTVFTSCVSMKKYQELETARNQCDAENKALSAKNIDLTTLSTEQRESIAKLTKQNSTLLADSVTKGTELRDLREQLNKLNVAYADMEKQNQALLSGNKSETSKILAELQKTKDDLQKKEEDLGKMEKELSGKKINLDELSAQLKEKEQRLNELQSILDKKDSAVKALKQRVSEALLGYENKGLTIQQKNGKVYISMDEKLLFATGSFDVAAKGVEALVKLSKVLEQNADINIMIEGHTDNVPYKGSTGQINDNWDLSVMRATSVVKILLKNSKIAPQRIIAAGRSQYCPVDEANTDVARGKNRRTEIILTPKLDELLKLLENN
ncbi:MAG: OmpA family protein [Bacteroidota bacterium]